MKSAAWPALDSSPGALHSIEADTGPPVTARVRLAGKCLVTAVLDAEGHLDAALYIARSGRLPDREWLIARLEAAEAASSAELLAGRPAIPLPDRGPVVCVCFDVGMKTIVEAIAGRDLMTVEAVGEALSAGTNCGSCRPAIQRLIGETREAATG